VATILTANEKSGNTRETIFPKARERKKASRITKEMSGQLKIMAGTEKSSK
jgi:hypothetical protein